METKAEPSEEQKGGKLKSAPTRKCQPPQEEEQQQEDYYILYQKGATPDMFIAGKLQSPVNSSSSFLCGCIRDSVAWRFFFLSCCCFSLINSVLLYSPDLPVRWFAFLLSFFPLQCNNRCTQIAKQVLKGEKKGETEHRGTRIPVLCPHQPDDNGRCTFNEEINPSSQSFSRNVFVKSPFISSRVGGQNIQLELLFLNLKLKKNRRKKKISGHLSWTGRPTRP